MSVTRYDVAHAIGQSLRDFGYRTATDEMVDEIITAWIDGKRGRDLPHGILGMFADDQLRRLADDAGIDIAGLK